MRSSLLIACLSAFLAAPSHQGTGDEPPGPALTERTRKEFQETLRAMQGGWQLVDLELPNASAGVRQEVAFMLVAQEFLSIEVHMMYLDEGGEPAETFFQAGTYRLSIDDRGYLHAKTLIGSVFDEEERLIFEPPGFSRFYSVETTKKTLTLTRFPDQARFVFDRLALASDFDFFGRPIPSGEGETGGEGQRRR